MNLEKINELTAQDMAGVNAAILEQLNSDVQLINQLGYYIVSGGGKRIRPMIAVLAARAVGYEGNAHVTIAALIEFIHTATLLHDDVVDESDMRRGKATANAAFDIAKEKINGRKSVADQRRQIFNADSANAAVRDAGKKNDPAAARNRMIQRHTAEKED